MKVQRRSSLLRRSENNKNNVKKVVSILIHKYQEDTIYLFRDGTEISVVLMGYDSEGVPIGLIETAPFVLYSTEMYLGRHLCVIPLGVT